MQTGSHVAVALVFLVGAFAGCIGAGSSSAPDSTPTGPPVAGGPAQFDDETGGIEGVITDPELQPVRAAVIGLLKDDIIVEDIVVQSDDAGRFSLSRVPPGDHVLAASALGYGSTSQRVTVEAGSVVQVSLILDTLAVETAYSTTFIKRGTQTGAMLRLSPECLYLTQSVPVQNAATNLIKTCNGARVCDDGDCEEQFTDETQNGSNWRTLVAELDWQAQSGATGRAYWLDVIGPNVSRMQQTGSIDQADKRYWMSHQGAAPIQIRIDLPETLIERQIDEADWYSYPDGEGCAQSSCYWFYRTWPSYCDASSAAGQCGSTPVDYGIQREATFTVYFSIFYIDPAPADFTGVPDA